MTQYGFHFDGSRCTGCKTCVLACKDFKNLASDQAFRQVYEYGTGSWSQDGTGAWSTESFVYYVSSACNHCDDPVCVAVCPQSSMMKDEETGLVYNNPETCIGCGSCVEACPYGAPKLDTEKKVSIKCDGCIDRVREGKEAICVEACPGRALDFGDIVELRSKYGNVSAIAPLPDPSITNPNVVFTEPTNAEAWDAVTGEIQNPLELV